ncbi:MAG: TIGR02281 family clan AA aspartic protease [Leptolyngbyaceae cyanobacterium]
MADSPSSPVNPFVVLCLLIVMGAGGVTIWKELSPNSSQADSSEPGELLATAPDDASPVVPTNTEPPTPTNAALAAPSEPSAATTESEPPAVSSQPDTFPNAIARAEQAENLSQLAQSQDDWRLVLNRWQQAIALMEAVPSSSPNYGQVAARLADYRRNQAYAQGKTTEALPDNTVTGQVVVGNEPDEDEELASAEVAAPSGAIAPQPEDGSSIDPGFPDDDVEAEPPEVASDLGNPKPDDTNANAVGGQVYRAPIVRRSGGTPVIQVRFNNRYTVEMIVDTGASGTVITQRVAQALGVQPTGRTNVSTASAQNVSFLLGEVESIGVNGIQRDNAVVAIAGPELDTGLLGNDFFGQYDVTVRSDVVEFQER